MSRLLLVLWVLAAAAASRCQEPRTAAPAPEPRPGDTVKLRGTLAEDVDCRLLRTDDGRVYSLSARIPAYRNGARVCIYGTLIEVSHCLTQPTIEVQSVRAWSSCP